MQRAVIVSLAVALCVSPLASERAIAAPPEPNVVTPVFNPANFPDPTRIDNPWFGLSPGTTFVYEGIPKGQGQVNEVAVTRDTKQILGVNCVVIRDRVWMKGALVEDTFDWYAQDLEGNVWYMGEYASDYKGGVLAGHGGSWEAGVNGAEAGILMKARPQVGDAYRQEYYAGEAEDMAEVLSVSGSASVPYGSWSGDVLVTKDWSPLERSTVEHKYYARGIGLVKAEKVRGGSEAIMLTGIRRE